MSKKTILFNLIVLLGGIYLFIPALSLAGSCQCTRVSITNMMPGYGGGLGSSALTTSCILNTGVANEQICKNKEDSGAGISNCIYFEGDNCVIPPPEPSKLGELKDDLVGAPDMSIKIPGLTFSSLNKNFAIDEEGFVYLPWIGEYLAAIYKYSMGVISIVAVVMIIVQGVRVVTSMGGDQKVQGYKDIGRIVIGLVIAWSSYLILNTINPNLVSFKPLKIKYIEPAVIPLELLTDDSLLSLPTNPSVDINQGNTTKIGVRVPYFSQLDTAWQQCAGNEIKRSGCGITSVAMVLKYLGVDTDPCRVFAINKKAEVNMNSYIKGNIAWAEIPYDNANSARGLIDKCLDNNVPVLIHTTHPSFTSKYHFMVITRHDGDKYYINDPSKNQKEMTANQVFYPSIRSACSTISNNCGKSGSKMFPTFRILYNINTHTANCTPIVK